MNDSWFLQHVVVNFTCNDKSGFNQYIKHHASFPIPCQIVHLPLHCPTCTYLQTIWIQEKSRLDSTLQTDWSYCFEELQHSQMLPRWTGPEVKTRKMHVADKYNLDQCLPWILHGFIKQYKTDKHNNFYIWKLQIFQMLYK